MGNQVRRKETEIGTLVSVTLKTVPDAYARVFSLLLPRVNVPESSSEVAVSVKALETTVKTGVAGPDLVSGQRCRRIKYIRSSGRRGAWCFKFFQTS